MSFRTFAIGVAATVLVLLCPAEPTAAAAAVPPSSADHLLEAGETLEPGQFVASPSGRFRLMFRYDGNLVLYEEGTALWSSGTAGTGTDRLMMGDDGALVMHKQLAFGPQPVWISNRGWFPGAVLSVRDGGGVVIRREDSPIIWSAALPAPDVGLDGVKHVVYGRGDQMVWLVDSAGAVFDSYPVSGRATWPRPGRYEVFSKSLRTWSVSGHVSMVHMVRFVRPSGGAATGFHSIPVTWDGSPIQSDEELGQFRSAGCVRQRNDKAELLYDWAPLGTPVVVLA